MKHVEWKANKIKLKTKTETVAVVGKHILLSICNSWNVPGRFRENTNADDATYLMFKASYCRFGSSLSVGRCIRWLASIPG